MAYYPGTSGNDTYTGTNSTDTIYGLDGDDSLSGLNGADTISGGDGNDTLSGGSGNDMINAGLGVDVIDGGTGYDTLTLDLSDEIVAVTYNAIAAHSTTGTTLIDGTSVKNVDATVLTTGSGNDTLMLNLITANATWHGGAGTDTLMADLSADTANIHLAANGANAFALGDDLVNFTTQLYDVESLYVTGGSGNDTFTAGAGNDSLNGGLGADSLTGGSGNDTYVVDNTGDVITELGNQGTDTLLASISWTLTNATSIEVLTLTGTANINATGNGYANLLNGNSGANALNGGTGADTMAGGDGNDTYTVDNAGDVVSEINFSGFDTIKTYVDYVMPVNTENLQMAGTADISATGTAYGNAMTGNAGNNTFIGGGGADVFRGMAGNDTYIYDNISISIFEEISGVDTGGIDTVIASLTYTLFRHLENLTLVGTADLRGTGNDLNNIIIGNDGSNRLTGGVGNDTVTGGHGADLFLFAAGSGVDLITDFSPTDNDRFNVHAISQGTAFGAGITITQSGGDTLIDLGSGNTVTVTGALVADVTSHMVW